MRLETFKRLVKMFFEDVGLFTGKSVPWPVGGICSAENLRATGCDSSGSLLRQANNNSSARAVLRRRNYFNGDVFARDQTVRPPTVTISLLFEVTGEVRVRVTVVICGLT